MKSDVHLRHIDYVNVKIDADPGIIMEIADHFTFFAPNYKYHPKYKIKMWDGKISLVNRLTGIIYAGLASRIKKFCDKNGYSFSFDDELSYENITKEELIEFIKSLNIPEEYESRDYQLESILKCLRSHRRTLLSPTSSGKSLMIYIISQWYAIKYQMKGLIVVPSVGLVNQMTGDFISYGYKGDIHKSTDKLSNDFDIPCDICITTWQSLNNGKSKKPRGWYGQYDYVIGDEAHSSKATCFIEIMKNMAHVKYRYGTTGTLDDNILNVCTIEGLFGPQYKSISTSELMEQGYAAKLKIVCIILKHDKTALKMLKAKAIMNNKKAYSYQDEIEYLIENDARNKFLIKLSSALVGNKLLFFRLKEQGKRLLKLAPKENVYYIDGGTHNDDRTFMRVNMENEENALGLVSIGTTSTGISIKKLLYMIMGHPTKSKIKVLQSIGRMLRLHESKETVTVYDIIDDFGDPNENFTLRHAKERIKIYEKEGFDYSIKTVNL